ncbi:MAG: T9SS type A sorting domain-containing protein [Candidatus Cloacimonetes bacterium]|nr:T9SS type A sorting domain-containing protein [Candidatus Cloacimonadota bacterium]
MHISSAMKADYKIIKTIVLLSLLCAGLTLYADNFTIIKAESLNSTQDFRTTENLIFFEDFDSGAEDWITTDITDPGSFWNTSTYNAYGGSGQSWRMADENIGPNGGYDDSWYQILDTPVITLPSSGDLILTFEQFRSMEALGSNGNFDGWDGFNVRIRKEADDYSEAVILTECNPAYNSNSLYSFGYEHNEDPDGLPGIPGWGGSVEWNSTSISIPAVYHDENVIFSFAFASDPNTSTVTNPEFTGLYLDNIDVAGVFENNGEDETGFISYSNTEKGGDLWHIASVLNAPSPPNVIGCFDPETSNYNANMHNYITSTQIILPEESNVFFDMKIRTALDEISFPQCDYFSVEVRYIAAFFPPLIIWSNWNSISNPLGDPELENVVFTGSIDEWSYFSANWSGYNDLSQLSGETIQLRLGLHSNEDIPEGFGIMIDNISLSDSTYTHSEENNFSTPPFTMFNYPNPFNPQTTISFDLKEEGNYTLTIFNMKGQFIKTLVNDHLSAGTHNVIWQGNNDQNAKVSSGLYFYKLENEKTNMIKKMILIK